MKRLGLLIATLALVTLTGMVTETASAQGYCSTTCPDGTFLECYPQSSCTSQPGQSITCDGNVTRCPLTCEERCDENYWICSLTCDEFTCRFCDRSYNACLNGCD